MNFYLSCLLAFPKTKNGILGFWDFGNLGLFIFRCFKILLSRFFLLFLHCEQLKPKDMKIIRYYLLIIVLTLCSVSRAQAQSYSIGDLTNHFYKLYFSVKNVDGIIYLYPKIRKQSQ